MGLLPGWCRITFIVGVGDAPPPEDDDDDDGPGEVSVGGAELCGVVSVGGGTIRGGGCLIAVFILMMKEI